MRHISKLLKLLWPRKNFKCRSFYFFVIQGIQPPTVKSHGCNMTDRSFWVFWRMFDPQFQKLKIDRLFVNKTWGLIFLVVKDSLSSIIRSLFFLLRGLLNGMGISKESWMIILSWSFLHNFTGLFMMRNILRIFLGFWVKNS